MFATTREGSLKRYAQRLFDTDGYANSISLNAGCSTLRVDQR